MPSVTTLSPQSQIGHETTGSMLISVAESRYVHGGQDWGALNKSCLYRIGPAAIVLVGILQWPALAQLVR